MKKTITFLLCPLLLLALTGCSDKVPDKPTAEQETKQKDAEAKMKNAFENDPTLHKSGSGPSTPASTMPSPGPVPGGH